MADGFRVRSVLIVLFLSYIIFPLSEDNKDTLLNRTTSRSNHFWTRNVTKYLCRQRFTSKALNVINRNGFHKSRHLLQPNCVATFQISRLILSGDISTNPGPPTTDTDVNVSKDHLNFKLNNKGLKVCHLNVRSLPAHLDEIQALIQINGFDLFLMTETWLNSTWEDTLINIDGYDIFRCDRINRGGGAAVYIKNSLICKRIFLLDDTCNTEYVCLEVKQHCSGPKMAFIVLYRPPNSPAHCYNNITMLIQAASYRYNEVIVAGDFNIDLFKNTDVRLSKIFQDAGLEQIVKCATRVFEGTETLIDHVYTTHPHRIIDIKVPVYGLTDHYPVCFVHKAGRGKHRKYRHETITYRNFKHFCQEAFLNDLNTAPWSLLDVFHDVNEKLDTWNSLFMSIVDQHAPIVTRRVKNKELNEWMTPEIMEQIRIRDQLKSRGKHDIPARTMYKQTRNHVVRLIASAKSNYFKQKIMENKHDVKNLWKILKRVAPTKPTKKSPAYIEVDGTQISKPEEMANAFNQYFTSISAPTTSDNVDSTEFETLLSEFTESRSFNTPPLFVIPPITGSIVEQDLRTISLNKATGLDGISIRLLKSALPAISPSLENINNASISSGIFPDAFKKAKVTPVHKKESTHQRGNFHPISVLPILSKPLERHVSLAFHEHLKTNKLLYINQSAYRANHSCETALLNITDKWLKEMDDSKLVGTVFMDLSKAFDLVNHDVLRSKLAKYHLSPKALEWFTSYLSNRSQRCFISGSLSSPLELKLGVPQGSILGPTLFSIYINDLPLALKKAEVDIYADDTTIWSSGNTCEEIQLKLQDTLDSAGKWFKANGMMPNTTKTKQLLIGTAQKLSHADKDSLDLLLNNTRLDEATDEKILGVKIDKHLKWDQHIDYLINKLNSRICLLKRAKGYLTLHCRKMLYNAIIKPILEYCCTVWGNCSKENLIRLLRIQKRCARLILDAKFSDNSVKLFTKLGWLPIDDIIRSRKLDLLHKISFGHCPDYFIPYIHYLKDTHNYNTKATTKNNLVLPKCKRISGCRTFHTSATRLWNNVDVSIRDTTSHKQFAGKVRQKLLRQNATLEHFVISSTF